jgi:hypothetical protein
MGGAFVLGGEPNAMTTEYVPTVSRRVTTEYLDADGTTWCHTVDELPGEGGHLHVPTVQQEVDALFAAEAAYRAALMELEAIIDIDTLRKIDELVVAYANAERHAAAARIFAVWRHLFGVDDASIAYLPSHS